MKSLTFSKPIKVLYLFALEDKYLAMTNEELLVLARDSHYEPIDDSIDYINNKNIEPDIIMHEDDTASIYPLNTPPSGSSDFSKLLSTNILNNINIDNSKGFIIIAVAEDQSLERQIISSAIGS